MRNRLQANALGALIATLLLWGAVPPDAPVADAAMLGDVDQVRALLRSGADVNAAQGDGMTALHWAAELGSVELAEMLVFAGANLESVTRLGDYTALHIASKAGRAAFVSELLEAGADPAATTSTGGATPLHFAVRTASVETVEALLQHGADVNAREMKWGQTPLIFAASSGRTAIARSLLAAGADASIQTEVVDMPSQAALNRAAGQVRDQVLRAFQGDRVAGGEGWLPSPSEVQAAIVAAQSPPEDVIEESRGQVRDLFGAPQDQNPDARDARGYNPDLPSQAQADQPAPVPAADDYDSSYPALVGGQGGLTALLHAVREGHVSTVLALLDAGTDINQASLGDRTTPVLMASINGYYDLTLQLLERGADPNIVSDAGTTPLFAVLNTRWAPKTRYPQQRAFEQQVASHHDVMEALLEAGADPNVRLTKHLWFMEYTFSQLGIDTRGATPFWRAAHALDLEAMEMLVEAGADPNIATMKPPARRFGRGGRGGAAGADPSGLDPVPVGGPGVFPIHAASGHGYGTGYAGNSHIHKPDGWLPAVRYLVEELGADVNARDFNGYSPVHNAASRGDVEMLTYLVEHGADVMVLSRRGQTTVDMANGPYQRIQPFPEAMALLQSFGAINNNNCVSC